MPKKTENMYVRAVVEKAEFLDKEEGYSPWYVGHADAAMLRTEILAALFERSTAAFVAKHGRRVGEEMNQFMLHLDDRDRTDWEGYTVFQSAPGGIAALDER